MSLIVIAPSLKTETFSESLETNEIGGEGETTDGTESTGQAPFAFQKEEYTGVKRYGGILFTLLASICFSLLSIMGKGVDGYGLWRYIGITLPTIPIFLFHQFGPGGKRIREKNLRKTGNPTSVFGNVWPVFENGNWKTWIGILVSHALIYMVSPGLMGWTSVILRYFALMYLTIGDTAAITYGTPVLVTIMAQFLLGERCGVVHLIIAFTTTLVGIWIVARPPLLTGSESFDVDTLIGATLAFGSLILSSMTVVILRSIRHVHVALILFVFGSIGIAQSVIMPIILGLDYFNIPTQLGEILLTAGVAGLSFVGQMSFVLAIKYEKVGTVELLRQSFRIIVGFILQFIFLSVTPDEYSILHGIVVLAGLIIIVSKKWIQTLPDDHCLRKFF